MRIDERMNLVVPLYRDEKIYAYVYSTPVSREVFEAHYWLIAKTHNKLVELDRIAGTKVAVFVLKDVAKKERAEESCTAFLAEITRLSNAIVATDDGWTTAPYQAAVDRKMIDMDDAREVDSAIVFFTVGWLMYPLNLRLALLDGAAPAWNAEITSLSLTDFSASLKTSTEIVSFGARAAA
jgi:hypothetical protein